MKDIFERALHSILDHSTLLDFRAVSGGDINEAFALDTDQGRFFMKLNDAHRYPEMFQIEAGGLHALAEHFPLKVPEVISVGEVANKQYLLLEWLQPATNTHQSWEAFGHALADFRARKHSASVGY